MCACVHWAWTAASNVARVARVARVASCSGGCRSRCITGKRRQGHASDAKGAFIVPPPCCCVCDRVLCWQARTYILATGSINVFAGRVHVHAGNFRGSSA